MEKSGVNRILSSLICVLVVFIIISGLLIFITRYLAELRQDLPYFREQFDNLIQYIHKLLSQKFGITREAQEGFIDERSDDFRYGLELWIRNFLAGLASTFLSFLIILVYVFLLLLNRDEYEEFILLYAKENKREQLKSVIDRTSTIAQKYLWGRIKVMTLLGIMYIITFLIFDLKHALLLTLFGALVTVIPYFGPFISGVLPMVMALLTMNNMSTILLFSVIVLTIQLIESYVLEPWILGAEVHLRPLSIIIAIILGGMLWGIPGMVLFVPIFAIIKIICDQIDSLKPIGFLLGKTPITKPKNSL